jgi:hypothetical protein
MTIRGQRILEQNEDSLRARAQAFQRALQTVLGRLARHYARDAMRQMPIITKAYIDEQGDIADDLERLLLQYGMRFLADSANEAAGEPVITSSQVIDAMRNKDVRISYFQEWRAGAERRAHDILASTQDAMRETVRDLIVHAQQEYPRPSAGEIARRIRNTLYSGEDAVATFSSERAALIARTELRQAQGTGYAAGIQATSRPEDEVEWLAYPGGGRGHDHVSPQRITVAAMLGDDPREWFQIPDWDGHKGAAMRYPGWIDGPIGHTANCRCSLRKWSAKVLGTYKPPAPVAQRVVERHIPVRR